MFCKVLYVRNKNKWSPNDPERGGLGYKSAQNDGNVNLPQSNKLERLSEKKLFLAAVAETLYSFIQRGQVVLHSKFESQ